MATVGHATFPWEGADESVVPAVVSSYTVQKMIKVLGSLYFPGLRKSHFARLEARVSVGLRAFRR